MDGIVISLLQIFVFGLHKSSTRKAIYFCQFLAKNIFIPCNLTVASAGYVMIKLYLRL